MAASLGEKLRQAREAKGLDLRDVADQTRIAINYLAAIEDDNYKPLPGGVFNKGFLRSFAKAVGIDEKEALTDYNSLIATQMPTIDPNAPTRRPDVYTNDAQSSPLTKLFVAVIVLGLIGAGVYFGLQYLQNRQYNLAQPIATSISQETTPVAQPTPTAEPTTSQNVSTTKPLTAQIKAVNEAVDVTPIVDNKAQNSFVLNANETRSFTAQQSIKFRYSKYRAGFLQIIVNGKPVNVSATSNNSKSNVAETEITPENLPRLMQQ